VSIGSKKVVLSKENGFKAREIKTGIELNDFIQVLEGLGVKEAIADNAQYLIAKVLKKQNNYAKDKEIQFPVPGIIVVMGCNTKNKEDHSASGRRKYFLHLFHGSPNKGRQAW
jgi:hypothetical protein